MGTSLCMSWLMVEPFNGTPKQKQGHCSSSPAFLQASGSWVKCFICKSEVQQARHLYYLKRIIQKAAWQVWHLQGNKAIKHFISEPAVIAKHLCTLAPKRPRDKPLPEQAAADLGLAQPKPHSPGLLGISLNFCFVLPVLITEGSQGLQRLSWQSNRFGPALNPA